MLLLVQLLAAVCSTFPLLRQTSPKVLALLLLSYLLFEFDTRIILFVVNVFRHVSRFVIRSGRYRFSYQHLLCFVLVTF